MLPKALCDAISWSTLTREAGSFIDEALADTHTDLLFSVELGDRKALLYLLLEHQSTLDHDMLLRMLSYLVRVLKRYRKEHDGPLPLLIPAVITHAPGGWVAPDSFHELFDPPPASFPGAAALVPNYSLMLVDLAHLSNEDLKARALAAFPTLALWALRDARNATQLLRNLDHWVATFRLALRTPHGLEAARQLLRYIALVTNDQQSEEFRAKLSRRIPEAREAIMTYGEKLIEEGVQKGLKQGRQEGLQEGLVEGQIQLLEKLLTLKFGGLPPQYSGRLHAATEAQLVRYAERTLSAQRLDDVFAEG